MRKIKPLKKLVHRVFDRLVKFDNRSRNYPVRALIRPTAKLRSYTWRLNIQLDQGSEGACTGFGVSHEAAARPVEVKGITNAVARALYKRAQQIDEWPGESYEGSSVLAAMKAGVEKGWYGEYRWAFGEADLALAIGYKGPAVLGIPWYEGMNTPDKNGLIKISGKVLGGHCICCIGINIKTGLYRLKQSWGSQFGDDGDCFISRSDMARLLKENGEACIPIKRLKG